MLLEVHACTVQKRGIQAIKHGVLRDGMRARSAVSQPGYVSHPPPQQSTTEVVRIQVRLPHQLRPTQLLADVWFVGLVVAPL